MSKRLISHTEVSAAYECQAKHALQYTGRLSNGYVLKPHAPAARLRAGRAWGAGVAAFHAADIGAPLHVRYAIALTAMHASLDEDANSMREHSVYSETDHDDMAVRLADILWDYATGTEPLTITDPEFELVVPIPSRTGRSVSNRYAFHGYLDGMAVIDERLWLAEYKLRDTLSDFESVAAGQQYRRYVWAAERQLGVPIAGIIVDERLSVAPRPARWVKAKRKGEGVDGRVPSHAKDQLTTAHLYREACAEAGVDPEPETVAALDARHWQKRHKLIFRRAEIEDAGRELVSAGQLIAQLDSGALHPVRNRAPWRCRGCAFASVCSDPTDREVVEVNFELKQPKRLRPALEGATT